MVWCCQCQVHLSQGVSPLRGAGLLRCASSRCRRPSISLLTGCHPSRNTIRPALPAETRRGPFPRPWIAGLDSFTLRVNEACLANWPACRSLRCASLNAAPARSPPRSPAKPGAGPLNAGCGEVLAAARPPRQSLACGSLGGTSAAETPLLVAVRAASPCCAARRRWQPVRQSSHRAPPTRPRRIARGTCGGIFKRWAGKPAHCFGC